jgi:hypothetical protein
MTGCSIFGIRTVEEVPYTLLVEEGNFQIRQYQDIIVAQTIVDSSYEKSSSIAFNRLVGYIFGNNKTKQKIAMTAPVIQETDNVKLAMTAPVLQQKSGDKWIMSFVMPSSYTLDTLPEPVDPAIILKEVKAKKLAAISYTGSLGETGIVENAKKLQAWLDEKGYKAVSASRSAGYDPPWTIPFLRRNEVHIDIE